MIGSLLSLRIFRPSSTLVPASRTTSGTCSPTSFTAWTTPWATQSQRLMPAKMLTRMALDVLVGEHQAERLGDPLGGGAAADVEEVGRLAAGVLDHVHGGHGEAGAVDDAADLSVEGDVVEPVFGRLGLARILLGVVAQLRHAGPAEHRVVVEPHLGVERQQATRRR